MQPEGKGKMRGNKKRRNRDFLSSPTILNIYYLLFTEISDELFLCSFWSLMESQEIYCKVFAIWNYNVYIWINRK